MVLVITNSMVSLPSGRVIEDCNVKEGSQEYRTHDDEMNDFSSLDMFATHCSSTAQGRIISVLLWLIANECAEGFIW